MECATHGDELPDKAKLAEVPDVALHLLLVETGRAPVERRAEVVREPLARVHGVHALGKLLGLVVDGALGLHPQQVAVRRERDRAVDGALRPALVAVEALARARRVPIPVGRDAEELLCELLRLGVREVRRLLDEVVDLRRDEAAVRYCRV